MERQYIRREMYLCIVLDRTTNGAVIIGSSQGGTSIEVTAHENPSAIIRVSSFFFFSLFFFLIQISQGKC